MTPCGIAVLDEHEPDLAVYVTNCDESADAKVVSHARCINLLQRWRGVSKWEISPMGSASYFVGAENLLN